jgi:hypothetical protein
MQLNGVASAMGYNMEALLHTVMQQILPHREQSHAALAAVRASGKNAMQLSAFIELMHSKFTAMMTRCPEPYFVDLEFFKDIPFVIEKDLDLLKRSGWMVFYARALKELINEQNKRIESAEIIGDLQVLEEQIRVQANIGDGEVINSLLLFEQFVVICKRLKKITMSYRKKFGVRVALVFPSPLDHVMRELRRIAETVSPDAPPPDPESSPTTD